jgi:hypothetical protein
VKPRIAWQRRIEINPRAAKSARDKRRIDKRLRPKMPTESWTLPSKIRYVHKPADDTRRDSIGTKQRSKKHRVLGAIPAARARRFTRGSKCRREIFVAQVLCHERA